MTQSRPTLLARDAMRLGIESLTKAGVESAALDMSLILAEALGTNRLGLYLNLDQPLNDPERLAARAMLARRLKHEPMAYILGRREFYGLTFAVNPAVLVPRPETELLVEQTVLWIQSRAEDLPAPLLADIGTGSGAIAIAVAHACPASRWIATDISEDALTVARHNALLNGVEDRIEFRLGSLLEPIRDGETLDGLCSNPPYVPLRDRATLPSDVLDWEPAHALFAGEDGLDVIRRLAAEAPARLAPGGLFIIECGAGQDETIAEMLGDNEAYGMVRIHPDLAGIGRAVQTERL